MCPCLRRTRAQRKARVDEATKRRHRPRNAAVGHSAPLAARQGSWPARQKITELDAWALTERAAPRRFPSPNLGTQGDPMAIEVPPLPYAKNALEPVMKQETFDYHYEKHHKTYATTLNGLIAGKPEESKSLVEIIKSSSEPMFNNAAQV